MFGFVRHAVVVLLGALAIIAGAIAATAFVLNRGDISLLMAATMLAMITLMVHVTSPDRE